MCLAAVLMDDWLLFFFSCFNCLLEIYLRFYLQHLNVYQFCKMSVAYGLFACLSVSLPMIFDILAFFFLLASLKILFDFYLIFCLFFFYVEILMEALRDKLKPKLSKQFTQNREPIIYSKHNKTIELKDHADTSHSNAEIPLNSKNFLENLSQIFFLFFLL